ncbi:MAG: glycosyltransferase [Rhodospirillaceae bacterium]|nr:glycosyltransferase [Rhodospirillaceae bacterium]
MDETAPRLGADLPAPAPAPARAPAPPGSQGRGARIALFPEASFGSALNCVGIAQALRARGAEPVFICHDGFNGVFADYGFTEYALDTGGTPADRDGYWATFIARHQPHFRLSPLDQIETYVAPAWDAIIDTAEAAERPLEQLLDRLRPDAVVLDNVVMFPAIARSGIPWVRVVSCADTELPDADVPPYMSGLGHGERHLWSAFAARYTEALAPLHRRYNRFRESCGLAPLAAGQFLEASPALNLLLSPTSVRHRRRQPLDPERFCYLDGCVRAESPFVCPPFPRHADRPLVFVSFGSLGAVDVDLISRMLAVFARLPCRFLVNVGAYLDRYDQVPDNVAINGWFPQPSVVAEADLFIHHGGNNSFCEALYFGVPSLVMPFCWDGHDNAVRAEETGTGARLPRYDWREEDLAAAIGRLIADEALKARLTVAARHMQAADGAGVAAERILQAARSRATAGGQRFAGP